jgi:uncharacterized protein (TIGR00251 family)
LKTVGERRGGAELEFQVRLSPRAAADEIRGWDESGRLRVRVTAPPLEGRANQALVKLLAHTLRVPSRDVRIVRGETSRTKVVAVRGVSASRAEQALGTASAR